MSTTEKIHNFTGTFIEDIKDLGNHHRYGVYIETFAERINELLKISQEFFELHSESMEDKYKYKIKAWQFWLLGFILGLNLELELNIENTICGDISNYDDETEFMTSFFDKVWELGCLHKMGQMKDTCEQRGTAMLRMSSEYLLTNPDIKEIHLLQIKCRQMYIVGFLSGQKLIIYPENELSVNLTGNHLLS